jgi:CelD/BcsL family acetyltransferase involved in cellulose biosynthesis
MPGALTASLRPFREVRRRDWEQWRALTRGAPPFLAPEFFSLTRPLADGEPLVAEAWDEGALVGVLPLALDGRTLQALRSDHTPLFDYWGKVEGLDAIWRALLVDRRWDVMMLKGIPAASPLVGRLRDLAEREGCKIVVRPAAPDLFVSLPSFESRMSSKFLANLRRCARKAGGVELERIHAPTRADFATALTIEAMAWKGAAGTSIETDARVTHLYDTMTRLFGRRGRASLSFLRAGGERIALLLSVEDAHAIYALKIGYDPKHAAVSPGHLMVWMVAADAERRGLEAFDFVGREDSWKHKWTDELHENVSVVVYRRSARGIALHLLREQVKPRLPERMRDWRTPLRAGCQKGDLLGAHSIVERIKARVADGIGIRSGIHRLLSPAPAPSPRLGAESRFAAGSWVRVIDEERLRATLDAKSRLRGLVFVPTQWQTCGHVYKVESHVRRLKDDRGRMRAVSGTVLLEGVTCTGHGPEPAGCGRHCPLMFRDEWLEPAAAPTRAPPPAFDGMRAHVRDLDEIRAGLDLHGRRDGVTFLPEMGQHAGKRFHVASRLARISENDEWTVPRSAVYILDGLRCRGEGIGRCGPCDRGCALLWHEDWLSLEREPKGR